MFIRMYVCLSSQHKFTWLHSQSNSLFIVAVILIISVLPVCVAVPFEAEKNVFFFIATKLNPEQSPLLCQSLDAINKIISK